MTTHVHFDIEAMRAQFLANSAAMFEQAMARAKSDNDRLYVQAQKVLSPALTELLVRMAEAVNQGIPDAMVVRSVGITLGKMAGSTIASYRSEADVMVKVIESFSMSLNSCLLDEGSLPASVVSGRTAFAGTPGGHA